MGPGEEWQEPFEDEGITLGPEEALRREIEKSKGLKIDRLRLKDSLEKTQLQNKALHEQNESLSQELAQLKNAIPTVDSESTAIPQKKAPPASTALTILVCLTVLTTLVFYFYPFFK